jgi:hypothetical protein
MSDIAIIKLVFGIMLSAGSVVLFTLTYKLFYKYLIQESRCTSKTRGTVKKYTAASRGNGVFLPVVFYNVNGKEYKDISSIISNPPLAIGQEFVLDDETYEVATYLQDASGI